MELIAIEWRRPPSVNPGGNNVACAFQVSVRGEEEARRTFRVLEGILLALTTNGRVTFRRESH